MKTDMEVDTYIALGRGEWSAPRFGHFTPLGRAPRNLWTGGCVGSRAGLDPVEERKNPLSLPGIESRPSGPQSVAIPTKLSCRSVNIYNNI
jgi:hypothetical protein